jgi:hypothetical protein
MIPEILPVAVGKSNAAPELSRAFFRVAATVAPSRSQALLTLRNGATERSLWLRNRCVVAARSNAPGDQLAAMLSAEGRLDPDLVVPINREACLQGRAVSEQLVVDHVISPTEVAAALERQVRLIFERLIRMDGHVLVEGDGPATLEVARHSLGDLIMEQFRSSVSLAQAEALLREAVSGRNWMWLDPVHLEGVGLQPWEARLVRRAKEPFSAAELLGETGSAERAVRFLAAMVALQAVTFETDHARAAQTVGTPAVRRTVIELGS